MSAPATAARAIGPWTATAIVVGNMIGSGIFLLPAALARFGAASLLGWTGSTVGALLLASVFARLSRRHPVAGGPYAYTRLAFGDFAGFAMAWSYWVSIWSANAAIAVAFAGNLGALAPSLTATPARGAACALVALWSCAGFNVLGVRSAGRVQTITTVLKVAPLAVIAAAGAGSIRASGLAPFNPSARPLHEVATATAALTVWAFLGLESATVPAEHVRDPARTIPRATMIGTAVTAALTVLACTVALAVVPRAALEQSGAPFADVARILWGERAASAVAAWAAMACFGALNGWTLMLGELPLATARDGVFPKVFARTDARGTPIFGVVFGSALATLLVCANYGGSLVELFTWSILLSTAATLLPYVLSAAAALVLERRAGARGGRSAGALAVAALAFAFSAWALAGTGREALLWGGVLLVSGLPVYIYALRGRRRERATPE